MKKRKRETLDKPRKPRRSRVFGTYIVRGAIAPPPSASAPNIPPSLSTQTLTSAQKQVLNNSILRAAHYQLSNHRLTDLRADNDEREVRCMLVYDEKGNVVEFPSLVEAEKWCKNVDPLYTKKRATRKRKRVVSPQNEGKDTNATDAMPDLCLADTDTSKKEKDTDDKDDEKEALVEEHDGETAEETKTVEEKVYLPVTEDDLKELNDEQRDLFQKMMVDNTTGKSYLLTGKAGTGKTTLLHLCIQHLRSTYVPSTVLVTASTALASKKLPEARTFHSVLGLPPMLYEKGCPLAAAEYIAKKETLSLKLKRMRHLVVDEVSMVRDTLFDFVHQVLCTVRDNDLPFGGVQLLLCGDFYQLPPVMKSKKQKKPDTYEEFEQMREESFQNTRYAFNGKHWYDTVPYGNVMTLKTCVRQQDDQGFLTMLNEIRVGEPSVETVELLERRQNAFPESADILCLFATKEKVKTCNEKYVNAIVASERRNNPGVLVKPRTASDIFTKPWSEKYLKYFQLCKEQHRKLKHRFEHGEDDDDEGADNSDMPLVTEHDLDKYVRRWGHMDRESDVADAELQEAFQAMAEIYLVPGIIVMLTQNIDVAKGAINGRRGKIVRINPTTQNPVVQWINDELTEASSNSSEGEYEVHPFTWSVPFQDGKRCVTQYPLQYAWAITIHKAQGMTLTRACMDLSDVFAPGHGYTGVSRLRSLEGLCILGKIKPEKMRAHHRVVTFYKQVESAKNIQQMSWSTSATPTLV